MSPCWWLPHPRVLAACGGGASFFCFSEDVGPANRADALLLILVTSTRMTFPAIDPPWWGRAAAWAPADRGSGVGGEGKEKRGVRRAIRDAILLVLVSHHLLPLLQVAPLAFGAPFSALALSASKRTCMGILAKCGGVISREYLTKIAKKRGHTAHATSKDSTFSTWRIQKPIALCAWPSCRAQSIPGSALSRSKG